MYLSQVLADEKNANTKARLLKKIMNSSIEAWDHINLHGEFDFSDEKLKDLQEFQLPKIRALIL